MRCWKVVAITCGIGKIAIVNSRLHHAFVSSNNWLLNWLLNCLGFLDRFSMRSLNMMDRKVGGCNLKIKVKLQIKMIFIFFSFP